jgi:hypothetical protein
MVRVKCTHCESTKGIHYQGIDGAGEEVLAETCDECGSYRKIVNQEKNPMVEPLADDLASLMLDLLMSETQFQRASANPLLFVAVAEEQQARPTRAGGPCGVNLPAPSASIMKAAGTPAAFSIFDDPTHLAMSNTAATAPEISHPLSFPPWTRSCSRSRCRCCASPTAWTPAPRQSAMC